jgi:hypothetical protein
MLNVVALCTGFCGVVLFTQLLRTGAIGSVPYAALVLGTLVCSIAVSRLDLLEALDLKNLRVTLRELQQVRADIYAKADAVKRLGEEVAALAVWNTRTVGRTVGDDHDAQMLQQRDEIAAMLHDLGTDSQRTATIVAPINDRVLADLRLEILRALATRVNAVNSEQHLNLKLDSVRAELDPYIRNYDRTAFVVRAKALGVDGPEVEDALDRLDTFLRDKRL